MGLNAKVKNGTTIADLAWKDGDRFRKIGELIYFRSHDADVKLEVIPTGLWRAGEEWVVGNFIGSEKVPDAPLIEGDVMARTDVRGKRVLVGHIHSRDNEHGDVQYYMKMLGIPIGLWRELISKCGEGKQALYLVVEMNEGEFNESN